MTRNILHDIIQASQFQYVVVITTASAGLHNFSRTGSSEDDRVFFEQVEERLLEWMGNMVSIFYPASHNFLSSALSPGA